ncbi:MAG: GNAT family N-acetyltransferase [Firmicutes bacterium]|nr:GNAT family N-acetyltransferase [Bacillota bacterium]
MKTLQTKRLLLRAWQLSDAADLYEYAKSSQVGPAAGWKPHASIEESREIIKLFIEEQESWAICYTATGKVIGSIGLHPDRKRNVGHANARALGYVLSEDYWGQGLMPEACQAVLRYAFEELKLAVLSVYHYPFNVRSKRVIQKLGFVYEGTLRKANMLYDGAIMDTLCYSLTREEYLARQR